MRHDRRVPDNHDHNQYHDHGGGSPAPAPAMIDMIRTLPDLISATKSRPAQATDEHRTHLVGVVAHAMLVREAWRDVSDEMCDELACRAVAIADRLLARMESHSHDLGGS